MIASESPSVFLPLIPRATFASRAQFRIFKSDDILFILSPKTTIRKTSHKWIRTKTKKEVSPNRHSLKRRINQYDNNLINVKLHISPNPR